MAVISVSVLESSEQVVSGIPRSVAISTNIPSVIFYTLDGSTPTLFSTQYTGPITLSTSDLNITLKILASNGVDSSPVLTETYITNIDNNLRMSHSATTASAQDSISSQYPYGTAPIQPNAQYLSTAEAGITVDNPDLPATATAFDGAGGLTAFTNQPYNSENYSIQYPVADFKNELNVGVGNFPKNVKIEKVDPVPNYSYQYSNMFDPRALVIFQDSTKENPEDPPVINRDSFSLEDPERTRDGGAFFTSGLDSPPPSASFVRSSYNPRTGMMTYYYFDSWVNRWIISSSPYVQSGTWDGNMAGMVSAGGAAGAKYVYEWIPFARRVIF